MSVKKVIEILAESEKSWEDAARNAVDKANNSVDNIQSVYVNEMYATVKNNQIDKFRLNLKLTFEVK